MFTKDNALLYFYASDVNAWPQVLSGQNLWSLSSVSDNEAVQEVSQYLIAAFFIVSVVRVPEKSGEFRFRSFKTRKLQDLNNISIFKFQRDSEFFQYVIIGHGLSIVFPGFSALPLY